jgi:hypothetical protein
MNKLKPNKSVVFPPFELIITSEHQDMDRCDKINNYNKMEYQKHLNNRLYIPIYRYD